MMSFPRFVELEEKRKEERIALEFPEFISAVFKLAKGPEKDQLYELNVMNYSCYGLALLITEKDFNLLRILNTGERIPKITLFSELSLIHLDCIVRHMTRIEDGKFKGDYILGLESNTIIEAVNGVSTSYIP